MKQVRILLSVLMLAVICISCTFAQKTHIVNKEYPINSFSTVKSDIVGNIIYTQLNDTRIHVEGDKLLVDKLIINEKQGVLEIKFEKKIKNKKKRKLTIYISSPSIEEVEMDGVGNFTMQGFVYAENLKIDFKGVGNFTAMDLKANNIRVSGKGVGNLTLGGIANHLKITSGGVGNVNAQKLIAKNVTVKSSGVGSVKCYASEVIDLENTGVGSIKYSGNPTVKNITNKGIGKIKAN